MVFAAVRARGQALELELPVEDPTSDQISVGPRETLTGEIDLERVITDLEQKTKESDIHLFWAYEAPKGLGIPHWTGGWILIPKHK